MQTFYEWKDWLQTEECPADQRLSPAEAEAIVDSKSQHDDSETKRLQTMYRLSVRAELVATKLQRIHESFGFSGNMKTVGKWLNHDLYGKTYRNWRLRDYKMSKALSDDVTKPMIMSLLPEGRKPISITEQTHGYLQSKSKFWYHAFDCMFGKIAGVFSMVAAFFRQNPNFGRSRTWKGEGVEGAKFDETIDGTIERHTNGMGHIVKALSTILSATSCAAVWRGTAQAEAAHATTSTHNAALPGNASLEVRVPGLGGKPSVKSETMAVLMKSPWDPAVAGAVFEMSDDGQRIMLITNNVRGRDLKAPNLWETNGINWLAGSLNGKFWVLDVQPKGMPAERKAVGVYTTRDVSGQWIEMAEKSKGSGTFTETPLLEVQLDGQAVYNCDGWDCNNANQNPKLKVKAMDGKVRSPCKHGLMATRNRDAACKLELRTRIMNVQMLQDAIQSMSKLEDSHTVTMTLTPVREAERGELIEEIRRELGGMRKVRRIRYRKPLVEIDVNTTTGEFKLVALCVITVHGLPRFAAIGSDVTPQTTCPLLR